MKNSDKPNLDRESADKIENLINLKILDFSVVNSYIRQSIQLIDYK